MIALKSKHDAAVKSKKQTEQALNIAKKERNQARINETQARINENKAKLSEVEGKLRESQAYIVIAQLRSQKQDFHAAEKSLLQAKQKIEYAQQTLSIVQKDMQDQALLTKIETLKQQIFDFRRFQITPGLTKIIRTIPFPEGYSPYTANPSWKWVVLHNKNLNKAHIWNINTQKFEGILKHKEEISAVTIGKRYIATGDEAGNVQLWDSKNGRTQNIKRLRIKKIKRLEISFDQNYLYASNVRQFSIWNIAKSRLRTIWQQEGIQNSLWTLSGNQKYLLVNNVNRGYASTLYKINSKTKKWSFEVAHNFLVAGHGMAFRKDSQRVALAGSDRIIVRDLSEEKEQTILGIEGVISLDWDVGTRFLLSLSKRGLSLYDGFNLQRVLSVPLIERNLYAAAFYPEKSEIGVWSTTGIKVYDYEVSNIHTMTTKTTIDKDTQFYKQHFRAVVVQAQQKSQGSLSKLISEVILKVSPKKDLVAIAYFHRFVIFWKIDKEQWWVVGDHSDIKSLHFTNDGKYLITASSGLIKVWNTKNHESIANFQEANYDADLHSNGKLLVLASLKGLTLLNFQNSKLSPIWQDRSKKAIRVAFSDQGNFLAYSTRKSIFVLDLTTKKVIATFNTQASALCFSSEFLAIGCDNGDYFIWDWKNNRVVKQNSFYAKIEKILYHQEKYSIITTNAAYIDKIEEVTEDITVYPIELFPGYYKGHPVTMSPDFERLVF